MKIKNRRPIQIRMNSQERSLLEDAMSKEDWENVSGFIKYKLFGYEPEERFKKMIESGDKQTIVIALKNSVLDLADKAAWYKYRYDRDMNQLYREEGVDLKAWIKATNTWHRKFAEDIKEHFSMLRKIAEILNLDEYFDLPSKHMNIDLETASKEEMDALAEQMRKERIAMGLNTD